MTAQGTETAVVVSDREAIVGNIVAQYLSANAVPVDSLKSTITQIVESTNVIFSGPVVNGPVVKPHASFGDLDLSDADAVRAATVFKTHLVSLIDGKHYRTLKRHLKTNGMTTEDYVRAYGLPSDYPMVCREYSKQRSKMAKEIGLGTKKTASTSENTSEDTSESDSQSVASDTSGWNGNGNTLPEGITSIEDTITDNHLICLEDGAEVKMLARYLKRRFDDMTVEEYMTKWGLPSDYPTVAPATARAKSESMKQAHADKAA
jgi:predicted transcriptional regulator